MQVANNKPIICYVTDRRALADSVATANIREKIRAAIAAGVDWIQIREKDLAGRELLAFARHVVAGTRDGNTRVIVNDRLDIAIAAGAAGVHLGRESAPVREVVRWRRAENALGGFLVGASCHDLEESRDAARAGADYIFFGPVFDTPSKRSFGAPQGLEQLREICREVSIPVIAIGGVNAGNAAECIRAGAAGIAAIRLFQEADAQALAEIIGRLRHRIA